MDPKERAGVAVCKFDSGIQGNHIGGHSCGIRTSLNPEMIKFDALQCKIDENAN